MPLSAVLGPPPNSPVSTVFCGTTPTNSTAPPDQHDPNNVEFSRASSAVPSLTYSSVTVPSSSSDTSEVAIGESALNEDQNDVTSSLSSGDSTCSGYTDTADRSITSSIRGHVIDRGLRYHAYHDGKYAFPNDENEQNCDDMRHDMTIMLCGGRYFYAPVADILEKGGRVLDLGTGTGAWAIGMGDRYPNAQIEGRDLSPIQPSMVPPNVRFQVDDFEDEWLHADNKYDYIHVRHTLHSVTDRKALLEKMYTHLKPGGWVEFQELYYHPFTDDFSAPETEPYAVRDLFTSLAQGLQKMGADLHQIRHLPVDMEATGFETVEHGCLKCPIGIWTHDSTLQMVGLFFRTALMDGLRGLAHRPLGPAGLAWKPDEIEALLARVRRDLADSRFHSYLPFHVVFARKPNMADG